MAKKRPDFKRIAQLKTAADFSAYLQQIDCDLPFDIELISGDQSPFVQPLTLPSGQKVGNRFCILPMEGWDGTRDGKPSNYTIRRWKNFAHSGAKLIWGGEAFAVRPDGRANPNQLMAIPQNLNEMQRLARLLVREHEEKFGSSDDLYCGLQLTHSGRFCKPDHQPAPQIIYHHPYLDQKFNIAKEQEPLSDAEIHQLVDAYIRGASLAKKAGFQFVDIKHCHGYLAHEMLSAYDRPGLFGGSLENRTRFLNLIIEGIRAEVPGLEIGVRLSVFDWQPFQSDGEGKGEPVQKSGKYGYAFGGGANGLSVDLTEAFQLVDLLKQWQVSMVCITAGSPYYNPHIQRPALFPPSDGYLPPEDPLLGVARQIQATARIKQAFPEMIIIGSAYSYLQEWLPQVAHRVLKENMADFIGLGRMVLSYPDLPDDIIHGRKLKRQRICRTFSDCTTAPRNGMISGCFPLDPYYKELPEAEKLKELKST